MRFLLTTALAVSALLSPLGVAAYSPPEHSDVNPDTVRKRHDYRMTFKSPYFLYENEHPRQIPNYETFGSAIASRDFIRLTPSLADQHGSIWAKLPNSHRDWQVIFTFDAKGHGYYGGNGFAFWYAEDRGIEGPLLGSKDEWNGLGLFFSTADQSVERFTPLVYGLTNQRDTTWNHRKDYMEKALGYCYGDFRGSPSPGAVRVTYANSTLKVDLDMRQHGKGYVPCFTARDVHLPIGYFFGFSASTGVHASVADDHDILSFDAYDLNPAPPRPKPLTADQKKKIKELENFHFTEEQKEHIEQAEHDTQEMWKQAEALNESGENHQLKQLMENQFHIMEILNQLQQGQQHGGGQSSGGGGGVADHTLVGMLNDVKDRLHKVEVHISELVPLVQQLSLSQNSQMNTVHARLDQAHEVLKSTKDHLGAVSSLQHQTAQAIERSKGHWGLYSAAFVVGVLLAYAISAVRRSRSEVSKKFI